MTGTGEGALVGVGLGGATGFLLAPLPGLATGVVSQAVGGLGVTGAGFSVGLVVR